jgi:hypothetical protein
MEGMGETLQVYGKQLRVGVRSGSQRRAETVRDILDHLSKAPMGVVGITLPCNPVRVKRDAGSRLEKKPE